jgi:hypothetical protein
MSTATLFEKTSSTTDPFVHIVPSSGTRQVSIGSTMKRNLVAGPTEAYVLAAQVFTPEAHTRYLSMLKRLETVPELEESHHLSVEDAREASEEEAWAAYRQVEPSIHNVIRMLADK